VCASVATSTGSPTARDRSITPLDRVDGSPLAPTPERLVTEPCSARRSDRVRRHHPPYRFPRREPRKPRPIDCPAC
jgi:hypothetical protein